MALIVFNPKTMDLELKVGILEHYKPSKEIKETYKLLKKYRQELTDKLQEINENKEEVKICLEKIMKDINKKSLLDEYMKNSFNPKLQEVINRVKDINIKICSNYSEQIK